MNVHTYATTQTEALSGIHTTLPDYPPFCQKTEELMLPAILAGCLAAQHHTAASNTASESHMRAASLQVCCCLPSLRAQPLVLLLGQHGQPPAYHATRPTHSCLPLPACFPPTINQQYQGPPQHARGTCTPPPLLLLLLLRNSFNQAG